MKYSQALREASTENVRCLAHASPWRDLGTVTAERDTLRLIVAFADARINNTLRVERRKNGRG